MRFREYLISGGADWLPLSQLTLTNSPHWFTDTNAQTDAVRFYRGGSP